MSVRPEIDENGFRTLKTLIKNPGISFAKIEKHYKNSTNVIRTQFNVLKKDVITGSTAILDPRF